jgi:hypothetical protein
MCNLHIGFLFFTCLVQRVTMLLYGTFVSMLFCRWVYLHMVVIFCFLLIGISYLTLTCFSNVNAMCEILTLISNQVFQSCKLVNQNFGILRELLLVCGGQRYLEPSDMLLTVADIDIIINEMCVG